MQYSLLWAPSTSPSLSRTMSHSSMSHVSQFEGVMSHNLNESCLTIWMSHVSRSSFYISLSLAHHVCIFLSCSLCCSLYTFPGVSVRWCRESFIRWQCAVQVHTEHRQHAFQATVSVSSLCVSTCACAHVPAWPYKANSSSSKIMQIESTSPFFWRVCACWRTCAQQDSTKYIYTPSLTCIAMNSHMGNKGMPHWRVRHDSLTCETWLIDLWDMTCCGMPCLVDMPTES